MIDKHNILKNMTLDHKPALAKAQGALRMIEGYGWKVLSTELVDAEFTQMNTWHIREKLYGAVLEATIRRDDEVMLIRWENLGDNNLGFMAKKGGWEQFTWWY